MFLVSGDANFHMERTVLTVGFTQPSVAKNLIELPASVEKGLTQRFLWIFPKPSFAKFDTLELIDESFTQYLGKYTISCIDYTCRFYQHRGRESMCPPSNDFTKILL